MANGYLTPDDMPYDLWLLQPGARPGERAAVFPTAESYYASLKSTRTLAEGSINYGQWGSVSSISPDVMTGDIYVQRTSESPVKPGVTPPPNYLPEVYVDRWPDPVAPTIANENENMAVYYRPDPRGYANLQGSAMALAVTTPPMPGQPTGYGVTGGGDLLNAIAQLGCNLLTGAKKQACLATAQLLSGLSGGSGGGCKAPLVMRADGSCGSAVGNGNGGGVPAGQVVTPADVKAVMGLYGAAITPFQIGNIGGKPILRCPIPGMVLGKDSLCYNKRDLRKDERKWAPARRPPMTGAEAHMLRTVGALKKKAKKLAALAGFATHARGGARAPARARRK